MIFPRKRTCFRLFLCGWLFLAAGQGLAQGAAANQATEGASLPEWVVLALKPISADRVQPVTAVVISADGLILVPQGFAGPGDQIIVLDGGTDIIANGRAATFVQDLPEAGLTVLSAALLKRNPAVLSAQPLADGADIRLVAFPPAEKIAEGAAPVWAAAKLRVSAAAVNPGQANSGQAFSIDRGTVLPNVTGAILDSCGYLLGIALADGVQSMASAPGQKMVWKSELSAAMHRVQRRLVEADCTAPSQQAPAAAETLPPEPAPEPGPEPEVELVVQPPENAPSEPVIESPPVPEKVTAADQHTGLLSQAGWVLAGLLAAIGGFLWWRMRRRLLSLEQAKVPATDRVHVAEEEDPAAGFAAATETPSIDSVLEITGILPDGTPFTSRCEVQDAAINVVIGRGSADLLIDSDSVQREHARLAGSSDRLTITDLGSAGGTWVNRVPCLKGEIMYVGAEDRVFLGEVSFQISLIPAEDAAGSGSPAPDARQ